MTDENQRREAAIRRVKAKRGFRLHVAIYAVVNLLLIVVWALTGAGYFWPIWPILGWESGSEFHYWARFRAEGDLGGRNPARNGAGPVRTGQALVGPTALDASDNPLAQIRELAIGSIWLLH